jgi:DUF438 domain-containing protein
MSELINNREYRQETIKDILAQLHEGKSVAEVKGQFLNAFESVSAEEISQAEQALISGGLPVGEVQRLCDVHSEVFKDGLLECSLSTQPTNVLGHPANTLRRENHAMGELLTSLSKLLENRGDDNVRRQMQDILAKLYPGLDIHYQKKENLMFPYMEQYGVTAPPKVMWGVDDEIRQMLRELAANTDLWEFDELRQKGTGILAKIKEMIFKEENILLPILLEKLTQDEWKQIADDSPEFGYCLLDEIYEWVPESTQGEPAPQSALNPAEKSGIIQLPTGSFTVDELTHVLNALPIDITFVGKDDTVKYFSQGTERIFPRTPSVIGRQVSNCHPPASVHIVEKLVEDFKAGTKDSEDFWIHMGEQYILIRYFAVRDKDKDYLGVLEFTQNIAPIQGITGEKRLVSE